MLTAMIQPRADERIVVTGGNGFIGRAVVSALRARGNPVTVVDRQGIDDVVDGVTQIVGDLIDPDVRAAAVDDDTGGIVHLAALTSVLQSTERPGQTYTDNVAVTHELLELARAHDVPSFVLASTNAVVGDVGSATLTTDLPLQPLTPYGATKAACEMLMSGYSGAYGMATAALRFTNVYGPGMAHKDSFVPRMMRAALEGSTVRIYGDGAQRRDLVHIDDVVSGVLAALDARFDGRAIIGSGRSVSVLELVDAVRTATGLPLPAEHVPAPGGEMPAVIVDLAHSRQQLGYQPQTDLVDGLTDTWRYFRQVMTEAESA